MARIREQYLKLNWEVIDNATDLQRVKLLLQGLDDEDLMRRLERARKGRRNEYPVRVCWNCFLSGILLGHATVAALLRELMRNPSLRLAVGMNPTKGEDAVPTKDAMSRFGKKLLSGGYRRRVEAVAHELVEKAREYLPDLGKHLAVDSTAIRTWARGRRDASRSSDPEARWGYKIRRWMGKDGREHEDVRKWFGYKMHLLVDTQHELPVGWRQTSADKDDHNQVEPLLDDLEENHGEMNVETLAGDKAYDDGKLIAKLYKERGGIRAVFDMRSMSKDGEDGEAIPGSGNLVLGDDGAVYCYAKEGDRLIRQQMAYWGFEKDRMCQKWRCPAAVTKFRCPDREVCSPTEYGRTVRVKCEKDWRRFGPMPRGTKGRRRRYNGRTAVERVNSRIKTGLTLDDVHVRGKARVGLRSTLAIIVLLGMAVGQLKKKSKAWRSLTRLAR